MKTTLIAIGILVTAPAAHAHRPHIIDCSTYAEVAKTATVSRDGGRSLDDALVQLKDGHRWDNYIKSFQYLVTDVYTSPELHSASPAVAYAAANEACVTHNAEERRTRELY